MSKYLKFPTPEGEVIIEVETLSSDSQEVGRVSSVGRDMQKRVIEVEESFNNVFQIIRLIAQVFINQVRKIADSPDEVEMSFGIKASGEIGSFVVAKATAEANYSIKLVWKRQKDSALSKVTESNK